MLEHYLLDAVRLLKDKNSPLWLDYQPVDWGGTRVYFGKASIM